MPQPVSEVLNEALNIAVSRLLLFLPEKERHDLRLKAIAIRVTVNSVLHDELCIKAHENLLINAANMKAARSYDPATDAPGVHDIPEE